MHTLQFQIKVEWLNSSMIPRFLFFVLVNVFWFNIQFAIDNYGSFLFMC